MVLTDRDRDALPALSLHGFLTIELIELTFFPQPSHRRRSSCPRACERLQQLGRAALDEVPRER